VSARRLLVVTEGPWFVHPVDGDDKNDGRTKRTALRTFAELDRRVQIDGLQAAHQIVLRTRWTIEPRRKANARREPRRGFRRSP